MTIGKVFAALALSIAAASVQAAALDTDKGAAATVAGTGLTTVSTIDTGVGYTRLCYHFAVATQNLDDFNVEGKAHASATVVDFTPTSWTSLPAGGRIIESSSDLAAVAAAAAGYFCMDVQGLVQIIVKASAAADSASVTPYWSLSR